jgi:HPt (histidine-containing phosphotransfer) domain-containing protein
MIDIEKMAAQLGFETEEVAMLLEMFLESAKMSLQELKTAIDSQDFDAIRTHAHSIKGSATNLTLETIYLQAKSIEDAARAEESIAYEEAYETLKTLIDSITIPEVV